MTRAFLLAAALAAMLGAVAMDMDAATAGFGAGQVNSRIRTDDWDRNRQTPLDDTNGDMTLTLCQDGEASC